MWQELTHLVKCLQNVRGLGMNTRTGLEQDSYTNHFVWKIYQDWGRWTTGKAAYIQKVGTGRKFEIKSTLEKIV
jgi:hypothetical protein